MQVDLLAPRKLEQQVQRTRKAVDIDDQGGLMVPPVDRYGFIEIELAAHLSQQFAA